MKKMALIAALAAAGLTTAAASAAPESQPASSSAAATRSAPGWCAGGAAPGPAPALAAVQFVDPSHGWVAGAGAILATSDGGRTWRRQYGGPAGLSQLDFIDREHGWAAGGNTLLRTTDGGSTWTPLVRPCRGGLASVHFVAPSLGYAVTGGSLARTTDGGATWTAVAGAPGNAQSACFASAADGYLGTRGRIWRTVDGGRRWTLVLSEPRASSGNQRERLDTADVECGGPGGAWVLFLGQAAAMEHSPYLAYTIQDDGREWQAMFEEKYTESALRPGIKLPPGPGSYPGPFCAIGSATAVFVGFTPPAGYGAAPLELVSDHGRTRTKGDDIAGINEPFATMFLSSARGWVVGENLRTGAFSLEATTDSGRTWTTQYTTAPAG